MIYYPGVILQARPRPLFWKEDRKQSSDMLVLFKCWYLKERSRYGDFGVKWGQTWGGPRPAIPWYLKTYRKHCYFQLKYTLVSPDSNNRIYTFFSKQPHQVPVLIIDQEKTTLSTPYKKSLGQNTRVTPHCRLHMSAQECRYNFKPTLLPEITHLKLIL